MENEVIEILKKVSAIITDSHFVYTSGRHGDVYIRKDLLYPHTKETARIGELFAQKYKDADIDVVVGPSIGGIILSQWVAHHLSTLKHKEILGLFTEKDQESNQIFKREYDKLASRKKVLVVEDLTTTGGSIKKVVESVLKAGGTVVEACVMVNRDPKTVTQEAVGAPFSSLAVFEAASYNPSECPLCKDNIPINTSVGHGSKFVSS